jgi:NifU homolog involved in Fe-S cluster formation
VGNPVCGDLMTVYIKVKDNKLEDVKFKTFGCGAAIATSSMITELAKGKTIEEALKITRGDVAESLGGLPPIKMHCSNTSQQRQPQIQLYRRGISHLRSRYARHSGVFGVGMHFKNFRTFPRTSRHRLSPRRSPWFFSLHSRQAKFRRGCGLCTGSVAGRGKETESNVSLNPKRNVEVT